MTLINYKISPDFILNASAYSGFRNPNLDDIGKVFSKNDKDVEFYHLFVPTTPNPTSGVFIIIPKNDSIETELNVEEALKSVISGGMLAPKQHNLG